MAFLPAADDIRWSNDERKFTLWCQGKTGYPIVDAGMRQLNTVGYMNSRVWKIVQCFLVKDLMVSWQKGEKYFMNHLIDGEMASVNGTWQWVSLNISIYVVHVRPTGHVQYSNVSFLAFVSCVYVHSVLELELTPSHTTPATIP